MENKALFAITCSVIPNLHGTSFFLSKESAKKYLSKLANERKNKVGVAFFEQKEDSFSYIFGWEEHKIIYSIIELPIND